MHFMYLITTYCFKYTKINLITLVENFLKHAFIFLLTYVFKFLASISIDALKRSIPAFNDDHAHAIPHLFYFLFLTNHAIMKFSSSSLIEPLVFIKQNQFSIMLCFF